MRVLVIAEAGVNHNGSIDLAKKLIDRASEAGADIVKFQTFKAKKLVSTTTEMAEYQKTNLGNAKSQFEMLKNLELSDSDHFSLKEYSQSKNIEFLSTAFDEDSLDFLVDKIGIRYIKIPSGELTNAPFLYNASLKQLPIILSTGMSDIEEIELALDFIAFGLCLKKNPSFDRVRNFRQSNEGTAALKKFVTILHCTSDYPTDPEDVNLNTILFLKNRFNLSVGFSDHSDGILAPLGAIGMGATIVEKHFTLDKGMPGPDHKASLDPSELADMIKGIRTLSTMLGSEEKKLSIKEQSTQKVARKFIVANAPIEIGMEFNRNNITCKRSGGGINPCYYWNIIGKKASQPYQTDQPIKEPLDE